MYNLAVRNRCRLLDINRSNFYYKSRIDISKEPLKNQLSNL